MKKVTYSAPSVKKAFKILDLLGDSQRGLGISDIAKQLKMGKSTVHGIMGALEELGVLIRDPLQKKYQLGYTLLELSRKVSKKMEVWEVAKVSMEALMERVEETVFLGVMNGDHITILDVVVSHNELKITSPPGTRLPLLAGATGKVFLAQLDEKRAKEIVQKMGLVRYTPKSIVDKRRFLEEVEETRRKGYAIDDEEYLLGVRAVAAPIRTVSLPPAAIWVVGFTSSLSDQKLDKILLAIQETTREINRALKSPSR